MGYGNTYCCKKLAEEIDAITKLFHVKYPSEETTNSRFIQQFLRINITFKDDDIQNWMSCDGPGYEHMDEQRIVALIFEDNKKEADEDVELCSTIIKVSILSG